MRRLAANFSIYSLISKRMRADSSSNRTSDCFDHEQSLVLDTEKGLVIFNSCSHGGADHIIREIGEVFPGKKIFALIGGFHLYLSPEREVLRLAEEIKATGIEEIYTGHCTGEKAFDVLHQVLGDKAHQIYTGMEIEI